MFMKLIPRGNIFLHILLGIIFEILQKPLSVWRAVEQVALSLICHAQSSWVQDAIAQFRNIEIAKVLLHRVESFPFLVQFS